MSARIRIGRPAVARAGAALLLALSLACPALAQGPADTTAAVSGARPITLAEALEMARRNAPRVVQAEGLRRTEKARLRAAYAAFVPSLTLTAGSSKRYGGGATRVENGTVVTLPQDPWSYNAGIGSTVTLFSGGQRIFDLRQARAGVRSAEANEVLQRFGADLDVKQQYFNVLAARESETAARAQVEQAEQQRRTAVVRLRTGSATKSDSLRSEIQLSNAQLALEQARTDLASADAALGRVIGVSEPVTAAESDLGGDEPLAVSEEELAGLAGAGPAVRQAQADRDAARSAKSSSWAEYLPSLSLSYSRTGSGSGDDLAFGDNDLGYTGSLRFSLSLPLFDQLGREQRVVQSSVAEANAEADLRDARLAAREDLTRLLGAFRTAGLRVEAQTASVAAAEEDLRVQQRRYALGESTLLDVLTSQTQLNDTRAALIRARYDQRVARAQLEALVGREL